MKKMVLILSSGAIFLCGCLIRTYTIYKPRKDTEVKGNQGYIMGQPPQEEKKKSRLGNMRPMTVIEVELGAHPPESIKPQPKEAVTNKKAEEAEEEVKGESEEKATKGGASLIEEEINREEIPVKSIVSEQPKQEKPQEHYKFYVVRKNDTLQKISYKFYGTTRKWKSIYEANKGVIKNPDRLYPGTKIRIPF